MRIFVRLKTGNALALTVHASDVIKEIKEMIMVKEGIAKSAQTLVFADRELRDELMLSDYDIQKNDMIHLHEEHPTRHPTRRSVPPKGLIANAWKCVSRSSWIACSSACVSFFSGSSFSSIPTAGVSI
jgi:hypothetical protein